MKRYGLIADGTFWYTPSRRHFTYRYKDLWLVYAHELDAYGRPIEGGNDELLRGYELLADAAALMTKEEAA